MIGKSKILDTANEWYDEIDPLSFYEKNFETTFLERIEEVYPDFVGIPFSLKISNPDGENSKPDLAIIRKDYKEWYIVEVEMGRHSWENHVEKQVRVFSTGSYPKKKVSKYIKSKNNSLDLAMLETMVDEVQPKVLVVVNEHKPNWELGVKKYDAFLSVFQIYKGHTGFEIYRIAGYTPFIYRDKSHCNFVKGLSNIIEIHTPTFVGENNDDDIYITFRGLQTKWKIIRDDEKVYLSLYGRTHFQLEKSYLFYLSNKGEYYLELN